MLQLSDEQLDLLCDLLPGPPPRPAGGRPRSDKRKAIDGIFWILDNGAKWKDLPAGYGTKSSVHRAFQRWVHMGAFETLLADIGSMVEERDGFKLYEWYVDGTYSEAKGGGEGIDGTKAGKGVKIMIMIDAAGRPIAMNACSASTHESRMVTVNFPEKHIGDKARDSDKSDQNDGRHGSGNDLAASRQPQTGGQDSGWLEASKIQASADC